MLLLIAVLLSSAPAAQALDAEAGALLAENRFDAALGKLEAANLIESTPERLLAIARCHREIAYARVHEAARLQPTEPVMRELAQSLDDLEQGAAAPPPAEPLKLSPPVAPPLAISQAPMLTQTQAAPSSGHQTLALAAGAGALAMFTAAALMHAHAESLAQSLNDPLEGDKGAIAAASRNWQTGSTLLVGAGVMLAATGLMALRF